MWYLDALEHPDRYDGKTLRVTGKRVQASRACRGIAIVFGREAMTCCANDIGGIGFVCQYTGAAPAENQWLDVTFKAEKGHSIIHDREAIILVQQKVTAGKAPAEELVYFNR